MFRDFANTPLSFMQAQAKDKSTVSAGPTLAPAQHQKHLGGLLLEAYKGNLGSGV